MLVQEVTGLKRGDLHFPGDLCCRSRSVRSTDARREKLEWERGHSDRRSGEEPRDSRSRKFRGPPSQGSQRKEAAPEDGLHPPGGCSGTLHTPPLRTVTPGPKSAPGDPFVWGWRAVRGTACLGGGGQAPDVGRKGAQTPVVWGQRCVSTRWVVWTESVGPVPSTRTRALRGPRSGPQ